MNPPEFFKYLSLISLPLFCLIGLFTLKSIPHFSFSKGTFSESFVQIKTFPYQLLFRFNFLIKAILDLGFTWYIIQTLDLNWNSSIARFLILQNILFATLTYYVEGKHSLLHKTIIYSVGMLWLITQTLLAQFTLNSTFILLTDVSTIVISILAYYTLFSKKTNSIVQLICMLIFFTYGL